MAGRPSSQACPERSRRVRRAQLGIQGDNRIDMKIVTSADMREIDRVTSERFGVPSLTLMENAGVSVAGFALSGYPSAKTFGIICGKGNNAGDGFVVARKLYEAVKEVRLLLLADPSELRGDAAANFAKLPKRTAKKATTKATKQAGAPPFDKLRAGSFTL